MQYQAEMTQAAIDTLCEAGVNVDVQAWDGVADVRFCVVDNATPDLLDKTAGIFWYDRY